MKRFTVRTALIAAIILVLMTGIALAIGNGIGVLNMLEKGAPLPEEVKAEIQTEFVQNGGELDGVHVRVRDAISDGKTLFVSVEAKAKDVDDAVLLTLDGFDIRNEEAMAFTKAGRQEASLPNWSAIRDNQKIHYLFPLHEIEIRSGADGRAINPNTGISWWYEGVNTLVTMVTVDLQQLHNPSDTLRIELYPTLAEKDENGGDVAMDSAAPSYVPFKTLKKGSLTVEVKAGSMPWKTAAAQVPFDFADFQIQMLEVTTTPLATYVRQRSTLLDSARDNRTAAFILCDADGNPYEDLVIDHLFVGKPNADGSWDDVTLERMYARTGDLPTSVVLRAMPMGSTSPNGLPTDLVVSLTETTAQ